MIEVSRKRPETSRKSEATFQKCDIAGDLSNKIFNMMKSVKSDYFAKKWTQSLSEGLRMLPKSKKFVKLSVEMDFGVKEKLKTLRRLRSVKKRF